MSLAAESHSETGGGSANCNKGDRVPQIPFTPFFFDGYDEFGGKKTKEIKLTGDPK